MSTIFFTRLDKFIANHPKNYRRLIWFHLKRWIIKKINKK